MRGLYEFSLTKSVNDTILGIYRNSGWRRVRRIMLKVSGMQRVNPELMAYAFGRISRGAPRPLIGA